MNKRNFIVAGIAALLTLCYYIFFSSPISGSVIGDGITLYRTTLAGLPTSHAFVYVPFTGKAEHSVANAALDINGDGTYAAYETSAGKQEEWIIVNDFADAVPEEASRLAFTVVDPDFGAKPMKGIFVMTSGDLPLGTWPVKTVSKEKYTKEFDMDSVVLEPRDENRANMGKDIATGFPALLTTETAFAQAPAPAGPAAGPDNYAKHDGVYDQDQRWNECAPTAVANSFRWLADKYGVRPHMPRGGVDDLVDELKGDLKWSDGVWHENIITGKSAFIARHHLPFEAHQIGNADDPDLLQKINAEIKKGQAVEVWLSFENASGTPMGAHLATVAGAGQQNGKNIITLTDPDTGSPNGRGSRDVYRVNPTNYLPAYAPGLKTFITYAYAQSPTQALIDRTWVDPLSKDAVQVGESGATPQGAGVTRTASRSKFGFFEVTLPSPGDQYVGVAFTVEVGVDEKGIERTLTYRDAARVLRSWKYKVTRPWALTGQFRTTGPVTPNLAKNRPAPTNVTGTRATSAERFTCTSPGIAMIAYDVSLSWNRSGGDVPPEILAQRHGTEFQETKDQMTVFSPPFRCLESAGAANGSQTSGNENESHTSVLDTFCPGVTADPSGKEMDVLRVGSECYPTVQFHSAGPDKCDAEHWHASMGSARSLKGNTWVDPSGCGF